MRVKRILRKFMAVIIVSTLCMPKICVASPLSQIQENSECEEVDDADLAAAKIVAQEFITTVEADNWSEDTFVNDNYTILYNLDNSISGYLFEIETNGISTGYITIGNAENAFSIIEYACEDNSISDTMLMKEENANEQVYLTDGYEYVKELGDSYVTQDKQCIDIKECKDLDIKVSKQELKNADKLVDCVEEYIKEEDDEKLEFYAGKSQNNTEGGVISSIPKYLKNYAGKSYTYTYKSKKSKVLSGVGTYLMTDLDSSTANCCTLTALCNAMIYYRDKAGYSKIPNSNEKLYKMIKKKAKKLGYKASEGLSVTKNNNLVKNLFSTYGYNVSSTNSYAWTNTSVKDAINNHGPALMSFASGQYYNHTVMLYGYKTYTSSSGASYLFFVVRDGWNSGARYVAGAGACSYVVSCLTKIEA